MSTEVLAPITTWRPRRELDVLLDQLHGIDAWNRARRAMSPEGESPGGSAGSRELRLDLDRRRDVVRRQHEALVRRTHEQLVGSGRLLRSASPARALVVHRSEWFKDKLVEGLADLGVEVVAQLENGADGVGVAVAEQPDVLVVEDRLPMIRGEEVVRQVRDFCPRTLTVVQVSYEDGVATALAAGAHLAVTRRVAPAELVRRVAELVSA